MSCRLEHGGRARSYVLHVPLRQASGPRPLLLAFHGGGGNGPGFQEYAGLDALADRDGWLVAYPNGTSRWFDERLLTWNAGDCCGYAQAPTVDDVGFALAVIDDVARPRTADRRRVYATGHSNGAMLAYRLAAEAAERVAAIAPVAGAMSLEHVRSLRARYPYCTSTAPTIRVRSMPASDPHPRSGDPASRRRVRARALARARWLPRVAGRARAADPARAAAVRYTPPCCSSGNRARRQRGAAAGSSAAGRDTAGPAAIPSCRSGSWVRAPT